jgi:hypothetical protein
MSRLTNGIAAGMVLKSAGPFSKKGVTVAPYRNLFLVKPGVTEACANLAEAAHDAADKGLINIDGLPGAAGYVRRELTGRSVNPEYWADKARSAQMRHQAVPQAVSAWRARAQALRGGRAIRA